MTEDKLSIDNRLENWRVCLKDKPQYNKTRSLEGNFKEQEKRTDELGNEIEGYDTPTQSKPVLDLNDALKVERAVIKLPQKNKLVLVCNYMYPYLLTNNRFSKTCNIIGISRKAEVFDDYLKKSKIMLENILNKNHKI